MRTQSVARRLSTSLVVGATSVIVAAATVDAIETRSSEPRDARGGRESPARLRGRNVPPPGALSGRLVFLSLGGCRLRTLDLASLAFSTPGRTGLCGLNVSPDGSLAAVPIARGPAVRAQQMSLVQLGDPPVRGRVLGSVRGEVAWSHSGDLIAWCRPDGETIVLPEADGRGVRVRGCRPRIAPDGAVLTRPDRPLTGTIFRDGEILLTRRDLHRGLPNARGALIDVVGYDVGRNGLIAVAVTVFETGRMPRNALELWRGRRLEAVVRLPPLASIAGRGRFGERVEVSPDAREVGVAFPGAGFRMVLVDVPSRRIVLPPRSQHGFTWSPDGAWFAISTAEEVLVYGRARRRPAYVLPIGAAAIAWRRSASDRGIAANQK